MNNIITNVISFVVGTAIGAVTILAAFLAIPDTREKLNTVIDRIDQI